MTIALPAALSIGKKLLNNGASATDKLLMAQKNAQSTNKKQGIDKQAQEFESVFLNTMLSRMFEGVKGEGPMGGKDLSQTAWRDMLVEQYSQKISQNGGIGLASQISRDVLALQEIK